MLVRKEYLSEYKESVVKYITQSHDLKEAPLLTIDDLKKKNIESEIPNNLRGLINKKYLSFNHFSYPAQEGLYQNTWLFFENKGKIRVKRKGVYGRSYEGEVLWIKRHICISLINEKDNNDRRMYFASFSNYDTARTQDEDICFIGVGINVNSSAVGGRELLIPYNESDDLRFEPDFIHPFELKRSKPELFSRVFSHIGIDENAVFPIQKNNEAIDKNIHGYYLLYYISSANNQLMRNRARFGNEYGKDFFHYETDTTSYSLTEFFYKDPYINLRLKDRRQKMYFSFHLEIGKIVKGLENQPEIILGSSSAISLNKHIPVASGVILKKITKAEYEETSLGWQREEELSKDETCIRDYLFLIAANPMVFHSVTNMNQLKKALTGKQKDLFMDFFSRQIRRHVHHGLKNTHSNFIRDLLEIIEGFTTEKQVKFKTNYVQIFRIFYHEVLKYYRGTSNVFYASSYAKEQYFWHDKNYAEELTFHFIEEGGKMNRIFYVDSDDGYPNKGEFSIIKRHFENYGKYERTGSVYVAKTNKIKSIKVFSTETLGLLSWDVSCKHDRSIDRLLIFTNQEKHNEFKSYFLKLVNNKKACTKVSETVISEWEKRLSIN